MRKWWKKLGFVAGCLAGLEAFNASAHAQFTGGFPPLDPNGAGGGMVTPPPMAIGGSSCQPGAEQPALQPGSPVVLTNDGSPNSFSDYQNCHLWNWPYFWGGAEYIYGFTPWVDKRRPLVTGTPVPNIATDVGAIGQPNTVVLARRAGLDLRNPEGVQVTLGFNPTAEWMMPFEVKYLYMHQNTTAFAYASNAKGTPLLARPIDSTTPDQEGETVFLSSFPGLAAGGIAIQGSLQVWGIDARTILRTSLQWGTDDNGFAIDIPVGFRYLNMNDVLNISSSSAPLDPGFGVAFLGQAFGPGNRTTVTDVFKANNEFRGGEIGVRFESRHSSLSFVLEPRVSIGSTNRAMIISGTSSLQRDNNNPPQTTPGGLLAVSTNSGRFSSEEFTIIPEATFNCNWDVFPWMRLQLGYNVAYWPTIFRAADQVNRSVDLRQVPTDFSFTTNVDNLNGPFFRQRERDFFLQGASIGLIFSY